MPEWNQSPGGSPPSLEDMQNKLNSKGEDTDGPIQFEPHLLTTSCLGGGRWR